jgi:hypothetical protein
MCSNFSIALVNLVAGCWASSFLHVLPALFDLIADLLLVLGFFLFAGASCSFDLTADLLPMLGLFLLAELNDRENQTVLLWVVAESNAQVLRIKLPPVDELVRWCEPASSRRPFSSIAMHN